MNVLIKRMGLLLPLQKSFYLLILMLVQHPAFSQRVAPDFSLRPGDRVPDITTAQVMTPDGTLHPGIKLSSYRGKVLILDFWATWCTACIANFPKLDSLKQASAGRLEVLAVDRLSKEESPEAIRKFFKRAAAAGHNYRFYTVVSDTELSALFPHTLIPHYVWIGTDGRVLAITSANELTEKNLQDAFAGTMRSAGLKKDVDKSRPLLLSDHPAADNLLRYAMILQGAVEGTGSGNTFRADGKLIYGRAMTNKNATTLYRVAFEGAFPRFNAKRFFAEKTGSEVYSIDIIVPKTRAALLYTDMLDELNRYLPYRGFPEKRQMSCLVLEVIDRAKLPFSKGGERQLQLSLKTGRRAVNIPFPLFSRWIDSYMDTLEVIDETGITENVDISLPDQVVFSTSSLNAFLADIGLHLREDSRELECYRVVRQND